MRIPVTEQSVLIPKEWLPDVREVDIQQDDDVIVVKTCVARDPIQGLGEHPVECGSTDGSEHHDHYLHDASS
jgi:hypothetical protein